MFNELNNSERKANLYIELRGEPVEFEGLVAIGYKCTNTTCRTFRETNIHPESIPSIVDHIPCWKCNKPSYLTFVGTDEFERISRTLKKSGTLDDFFYNGTIED